MTNVICAQLKRNWLAVLLKGWHFFAWNHRYDIYIKYQFIHLFLSVIAWFKDMPPNSYSYSHVSIFQNAVSVCNMEMIGELQDGYEQTDGLMQERRHSIASALEWRFSCTNPSRQGCAIYKSEAEFGQICCDAKTPSVERYLYSPEWIHPGLVKKAVTWAVSCPVHHTSHILYIDFAELE